MSTTKTTEKPVPKTARACPDANAVPEHAHRLAEFGAASAGRSAYQRYLAGEPIRPREAMEAACFTCMGGFADGRRDCEMPACPIYPWQPYRRGAGSQG